MGMKKAKIEGKLVDVISDEEYVKNSYRYDPNFTAVEKNGIMYPVRKTDPRKNGTPGFYNNGFFGVFVDPDKNAEEYNVSKAINFEDSANIKDIIEKSADVQKLEREILTDIDNVTKPNVGEDDEELMKALKETIIAKHIDLDKYDHRFSQPSNDKRLIKKSRISWGKFVEYANALDFKVTVTIEDKYTDVPNPIRKIITARINHPRQEDN